MSGVFDHGEVERPLPAGEPAPEPGAAEDDPVGAGLAPPDADPVAASEESVGAGLAPPDPDPDPVAQPVEPAPDHAAGQLDVPSGIRVFGGSPNGARRSVGIAVGRFNGEITSKLLDGALAELDAAGVVPEAIEVMPVPGAFELPLAAMALAKSRRYSCVVALGCVIRGETPHFEFVSAEAASGVQLAGLETGVPVAFGVLTCDTLEQAEERAGGSRGNKGTEAARSALEMVESLSQLRSTLAS